MRHHHAKPREKRFRTGPIGKSREDASNLILADREARTECVRIDADAFEFAEQLLELFFL